MSDIHLKSLIQPFRAGTIPASPKGCRVLCLGIREYQGEFATISADIVFVQGFRPDYLSLDRAGCRVVPEMPDQQFDCALIRLGRHRGENENWIATAIRRLRPGGFLVVAGARTEGVSSMRRRIATIVPEVAHRAMNHGEVFWFSVPADAGSLAIGLTPPASDLIENRYQTSSGMFSHGHVDPGSRLLASRLPPDLSGWIADFGAGWGYLSAEIAGRFPSVKVLHLYEADFAALEAARANVIPAGGIEIAFYWQDLLTEPPAARYDAIVMNPPFHAGRRAEPELGQALITRAAGALKAGGRLFMVANRQLPYEAVIGRCFGASRELAVADGYKVIEAGRPRARTDP